MTNMRIPPTGGIRRMLLYKGVGGWGQEEVCKRMVDLFHCHRNRQTRYFLESFNMWKRRKGYSYFSSRAVRMVYVPPKLFWSETNTGPTSGFANRPECGARIQVVRNKRGGWASFEPGLSSLGTLHPCFSRGRNLSKSRPDDMGDLFDE